MKNNFEEIIDKSIFQNVIIKNNFIQSTDINLQYTGNTETVKSFGEEWNLFKHTDLTSTETASKEYFDVFPLEQLNKNWIGVDVGCGTGRWARRISPYIKTLYGVDPSEAINIFIENTKDDDNIIPVKAYAENLPFQDKSIDLVVSYGVLHHIEKTEESIAEINRILKNNGIFLFYFYYNLDNRSLTFKCIFSIVNIMRKCICKFPPFFKKITCDFLALFIYFPCVILAKIAKLIFGEKIAAKIPLSSYRNKNFYIMRNDCLDRFGTPLEKRYSKEQITKLLKDNGFKDVIFSNNIPYWHGYAIK